MLYVDHFWLRLLTSEFSFPSGSPETFQSHAKRFWKVYLILNRSPLCLLTTGAFASGVSGMAKLHAWSAEVSVSWKYHANLSKTLLLLLPPWCTFYTPMLPWLKTLTDGNSPRKVSVRLTLSATFYASQMLLVGHHQITKQNSNPNTPELSLSSLFHSPFRAVSAFSYLASLFATEMPSKWKCSKLYHF